MAKRGYTPEQIINKLREAEPMLQQRATITTISKSIGVSSYTYYRWRKEYGGLRVDQAKKLKTLEQENARLTCLLLCRIGSKSILRFRFINYSPFIFTFL